LFALLAPAAVAGVAVLVHALPGMGPAASLQVEMPGQVAGLSPWVLAPILFLVNVFLGGALCEELGWRGFMLPRLQERYGPARASLVLGVTWGLWHLPLFFIAGTVQSRIPFLLFLLSTCASSFLFTWVSDRGRGSVLLAVLLHAAINTTASVAPVAPHDWTLLALTWGLVGVLYLAPARRVVT
ncbi:MAG TPA: CPBP family intramembrane glutamic endopeptidase, partial [Symbiobacteriaceae bacterium]|nr:CPBP family intramembrane glutamic endopeptidase [Symbiobacteriaceae bacterium]